MKPKNIGVLILICLSYLSHGQSKINKVNVINKNNNIFLSVQTKIKQKKTIKQAVENGITLHFKYQIRLKKDKWYTLFDFAKINKSYYLSYNHISNEYLLLNPITYKKINDKQFDNIINKLENLNHFPLINYNLIKNKNLIGEIRFILDTDTLPTFLHLETIWSKNWEINSDWEKWEIK